MDSGLTFSSVQSPVDDFRAGVSSGHWGDTNVLIFSPRAQACCALCFSRLSGRPPNPSPFPLPPADPHLPHTSPHGRRNTVISLCWCQAGPLGKPHWDPPNRSRWKPRSDSSFMPLPGTYACNPSAVAIAPTFSSPVVSKIQCAALSLLRQITITLGLCVRPVPSFHSGLSVSRLLGCESGPCLSPCKTTNLNLILLPREENLGRGREGPAS